MSCNKAIDGQNNSEARSLDNSRCSLRTGSLLGSRARSAESQKQAVKTSACSHPTLTALDRSRID